MALFLFRSFSFSTKILNEFPEVIEKVSGEPARKRDQFKLSIESPVEKDAVEWAWPLEDGDTMFNVVNAYTMAAQFEGLTAEASYKLQKVGGNILGMLR